MNTLLEQLLLQQLFAENTINYAEAWQDYAPVLYLIQLKLALVFFALWLIILNHTDTQF